MFIYLIPIKYFRCPYMACANSRPLKIKHLKLDPVMDGKIKSKLQRMESNEQGGGGTVPSSSALCEQAAGLSVASAVEDDDEPETEVDE